MSYNAKLRKSSRLRRESTIETASEESGSDREIRLPRRGQQKTQKIIDKLSNSYMDTGCKGETYDADVDSASSNSSESLSKKSPQIYNFEDMTDDVYNLQLALSPEKKIRGSSSKGKSKKEKENFPKKLQEHAKSKETLSRGIKQYLQKEKSKKCQETLKSISPKSIAVLAEKGLNSKKLLSKNSSSFKSKELLSTGKGKNKAASATGDSGIFSPGESSFRRKNASSVIEVAPTSTPSLLIKTKFKKTLNKEQFSLREGSPMLSPVERYPSSEVRGKFVDSPADIAMSPLDLGSPKLKRRSTRKIKTEPPAQKSGTGSSESDEGFLSLNKSGSTFEGRPSFSPAMKKLPTSSTLGKGKKRNRKAQCEIMDMEIFSDLPMKKSAKRKTKASGGQMKNNLKKQKTIPLGRQETRLEQMKLEFEELNGFELSIE